MTEKQSSLSQDKDLFLYLLKIPEGESFITQGELCVTQFQQHNFHEKSFLFIKSDSEPSQFIPAATDPPHKHLFNVSLQKFQNIGDTIPKLLIINVQNSGSIVLPIIYLKIWHTFIFQLQIITSKEHKIIFLRHRLYLSNSEENI